MAKSRRKTEFGDFQTPPPLANEVCARLVRGGVRAASIVEPTCGRGNLLFAALDHILGVRSAMGVDLNAAHLDVLRSELARRSDAVACNIVEASFFALDWPAMLADLPDPLLVIGNPPWVTNATLGGLGSENIPQKKNHAGLSGMDALTGKSNFDISEWMLLRMMDWFRNRTGTLAMLCKTAVARKVLAQGWKRAANIEDASVFRISADEHFEAAVDACLLVCRFESQALAPRALVYSSLQAHEPESRWGWYDGMLIADADAFQRNSEFVQDAADRDYVWRSGIKHDCAKVMEFRGSKSALVNGFGEQVVLESDCLYPLLKSSDIAHGRTARPRNWMLVPQTSVSADTSELRLKVPRTWDYLSSHAEALDGRKSSIYRQRPRFAVFGVGDYSFAPSKVAISGFYKRLTFTVVHAFRDDPVVFDDTVYFLACRTPEEAELVTELLNSPPAQDFFSAFVFWDAKRPITAEILSRLDLRKLARHLGRELELDDAAGRTERAEQMQLF
jgi:hypothetical protein